MYKILVDTKNGMIVGVISLIIYASISTLFWTLFSIIFWDATLVDIKDNLFNRLFIYSFYLIIPFAIICSIISAMFSLIISLIPNLHKKFFIGICTFICILISLSLYYLTRDMIYNIDEDTVNILNIEFRTIPYTLFVIWGYFVSKQIHQKAKKLSNGMSSS